MNRLNFLDNLKAFIIIVVVAHHVAMGYTTWDLPSWYVNDTQKNQLFNYFINLNDGYMMPIMFFVSGYFAPMVLSKKGARQFWQDKFKRIVLPWLGGIYFIAPMLAYSIVASRTKTPPNYFSFWLNDFIFGKYFEPAHFWFLGILVLFFLLLTFAYKLSPEYFVKQPQPIVPSVKFFTLFCLVSALCFFSATLFYRIDSWVSFIFQFQPERLGLYVCYFWLGIHAWKSSWLMHGGYSPRLFPWTTCASAMLFVFLFYRVLFVSGDNISLYYKAGYALTYSLFCLTMAFALIAVFRRFVDSDAYLWRRLAANSFTIYFIHQCFVIPLAYAVQQVHMNIWLKFLGVFAVSFILSFLAAEYVIGPMLRFGTKPKKQ